MKGVDLKRLREQAGLTIDQLASLVYKSKRTIINWENSEKELSQDKVTLVKSALALENNSSANISPRLNESEKKSNEQNQELERLRTELEMKNQHIQLLNEKLKKCEEDLFFNRKPDKRDA